MPKRPTERERLAERIRARLRGQGLQRLEMSVIVLGTGLAGFFFSAVLFRLGVSSMPARYAASLAGAYLVFLLLIRLWVELHRRGIEIDLESLDVPIDLANDAIGAIGDSIGRGGSSGGGGADAPYEFGSGGPSADAGGGGGGGLDLLDLDDAFIVIVPIVMFIGGLIAALLIVWSAPALLVEIVLDVVLVSGLYRRLAHLERRSWLLTAVRRTWVPIVITAVVLVAGGFLIQAAVPEAETVGDVFR
jgi:hypothetical protein